MNFFKKWGLLLSGGLLFYSAFAEDDHQIWYTYFQQGRLTNKAGYWFDANFRTHEKFSNSFSAVLLRGGGTYFIREDLRLTAGYVYMMQFSSLENQSFFKQEHRPWLILQYFYSKKFFRLQTNFRAEHRIIQKSKGDKILPGYEHRLRPRLAVGFSFMLNKRPLPVGNILFFVNEEILTHAYTSEKLSWIDQQRVFAGFSFQINESFQLQTGYMHIYQATKTGFDHLHCLRFTFIHTPDFRKKKKED